MVMVSVFVVVVGCAFMVKSMKHKRGTVSFVLGVVLILIGCVFLYDDGKQVGEKNLIKKYEAGNEEFGWLVGKRLQVFAIKKLANQQNVIFFVDETGKQFEFGIYKSKE